MSVSAPHNEIASLHFDAVQLLQLLDVLGAVELPPGAVYRGCKVAGGQVEFEVSYCDEAKYSPLGKDISKIVGDQRWVKEGVARGLEKLQDRLDERGLLPPPGLADIGIDFKAETRAMMEEQRFIKAEQDRVQAEMDAAQVAIDDAIGPPTVGNSFVFEPLMGMEPVTEAAKTVTLSEAFGRAVHAVHNPPPVKDFPQAVRTVYDAAHKKPPTPFPLGDGDAFLADAARPVTRGFTDRAIVLENHNDKSPFLLPYLEGESREVTRTRLERFMTARNTPPGDVMVLRAALGLWFARKEAGHHTAETVQADDDWFPLDYPKET